MVVQIVKMVINSENATNSENGINNENGINSENATNSENGTNGSEIKIENIKKREEISKEESEKLKSLYKDPEGDFERFFETLFAYIENNENQLPAIKQKYDQILKSKFVEIHQKLKTCDQQIQFLESLYIQKELQEKIPLTGVEKISFVMKDQTIFGENNYGPSELFARYIFTIVFSKLKNGNIHKSESTSNQFYSDSIFDKMGKSFQEWKPLLQFWFVYVLLIQQLFKKEANIEEFTQEKTLFELVKKVRSFKSKEEGKKKDKKDKKKKKQHQRGGSSEFGKKENFQKFKQQKFKQNIKKIKNSESASNQYKEFMKKIIIRKDNEDTSLYSFLNGSEFHTKIKEFYQSKLHNSDNNNDIPCNKELNYIGDDTEKFSIKMITDCGNKKNHGVMKKEYVLSKLKDKMTIFQTLFGLDYKNSSMIKKFLTLLNQEILFFYFVIYYKKKFIYMRYLEIFKNILRQKEISYQSWIQEKTNNINQHKNLKIQNQQNENQQNKNQQNKNQYKENQNNSFSSNQSHSIISLSSNQLLKVKELNGKIQILKDKKSELEKNRNQPNYDKKILLIEKYIHDLILEKRKIYS